MIARTNRWLVALIAGISALGVASCNPFPAATGGTASIVRALVFDSAPGDGQDDPTVVEAPTAGAWLINNGPQGSYGAAYNGTALPGKRVGLALQLQFSKQLDGRSVQATTGDCRPTVGAFVFPTPPSAAETWYACYSPGNPDPSVGSTIIIWKGQVSPSSRMNDPRFAIFEPATNYHITGAVKDQDGNTINIDTTFKVSGERIDGPTVTDANPVAVSWTAADGGAGAVTYDVERANNFNNGFNDSPDAFAPLAGATGLAGTTYSDATVVSGQKYWYRITSHYAQNGTFATGAPSMATVP